MKLPRVSAPDWMALTPMNITAAMPAAVISATSNPYPPSEKTSRSRARIPSLDLCTKRFSSRFSWPNAFTTRAAPKTSCTTASAELSIFLTSRDWRRNWRRKVRDTRKMAGETAKATIANCQLIRAVT